MFDLLIFLSEAFGVSTVAVSSDVAVSLEELFFFSRAALIDCCYF
jgi:hypothetical protein